MAKLVVVESPAKAKTIEKYLGSGYTVLASKGHIADLPKSGLAVDVEKNFEPEYAVMDGKQKVIRELKQALKDKDELIIAVDPDREGEAIGWHVANRLGLVDLKGKRKKKEIGLKRIVFTEITKKAVQEALQDPRELDINLLNSQQARRVLDRIVGYKLSPLLWKKIRYGLSAGRVQSVAVKFIVDREKERDEFKPEEYWKLFADLSPKSGKLIAKTPEIIQIMNGSEDKLPEVEEPLIRFELSKIDGKKHDLTAQKDIENIVVKLQGRTWELAEIEKKETKRHPKPPFTTSTMQQTAANWFGYTAKRTMSLAQKLYERGEITYMRTDSTNLSADAVTAARAYITKELGKDYQPEKPNYYRTKAKVSQEAHEAIRPADFKLHPEQLKKAKPDEQKLYRLIWQRALASQMTPARVESAQLKVLQELDSRTLEFKANGQKLLFPGYLKIYPEKLAENILPDLKKGSELYPARILSSQHYTQPPGRYSEATLIKELEKYGIGRPSTYAPIISTIEGRRYVEKEGSYFKPTDTGIVVTRLLAENFSDIVDRDFTANMEEKLDLVANGEHDWVKLLTEFYGPFAKNLEKKDKSIVKDDFTVLGDAPKDIICPDCNGKMLIKLGKYGRFYSCAKFPDCKGMLGMDGLSQEDIENKPQTKEFKDTYNPAPQTDDGRDFTLKKGRFGEFWAHPDYPKVKDARPLELRPEVLREKYGEPPVTDDDREFEFRNGKFGPYWAHPDYPEVKETYRIRIAKDGTVTTVQSKSKAKPKAKAKAKPKRKSPRKKNKTAGKK